tara:strand:+ start:407 stop:2476 length:2070 start_codon:yes stop_codon:yes gene_type:complete
MPITNVDRSNIGRYAGSEHTGILFPRSFAMPTCYSYLRFSDTIQSKGLSIVRQIDKRDKWLDQNKDMILDTTISLRDLGVSAFRGRNLDPMYGDLGKFIDLVKRKDSPIEPNSVLLLERLDRFSRNEPMLAIGALQQLIYNDIRVVVTEENLEIDKKNINDLQVILPVVLSLCMAHQSSKDKSYHVGNHWKDRRNLTGEKYSILTKKLPSWLYYDEDKQEIKVHKEKSKAIQYIFKRTLEGVGQCVLVKELNEKFVPISTQKMKDGQKRLWNTSYVSKLLNDKSLIGVFQPKTKDEKGRRIDAGEVWKNYYPVVIKPDDFFAAQYQKNLRKKEKTNKESTFVNLFTSLVINNYDNQVMQITTSRNKRTSGEVYIQRRLVSYGKKRHMKNCANYGIDYFAFEKLMLDGLSELNPEDFKERFDSTKERRKLYEEIEGCKSKVKELEKALTELDSKSTTSNVINSIEDLNNRIEYAQHRIEALTGVDSKTGKEIVEGLKTLTEYSVDRYNDGDQNIRNKIRSLIPTIVDKINIRVYKQKNRRTIASGKIYLTNGKVRKFDLWTDDENPVDLPVLFMGKNNVPAKKLTRIGSISYDTNHGAEYLDDDGSKRKPTGSELLKDMNYWSNVSLKNKVVYIGKNKFKTNDRHIKMLEEYERLQTNVFMLARPEGQGVDYFKTSFYATTERLMTKKED